MRVTTHLLALGLGAFLGAIGSAMLLHLGAARLRNER